MIYKLSSISYSNSEGVIKQTTSLMLIGKCQTDWFKVTFLGGAETIVKCWFAVLEASNFTLVLLFLFF